MQLKRIHSLNRGMGLFCLSCEMRLSSLAYSNREYFIPSRANTSAAASDSVLMTRYGSSRQPWGD